MKPPASLLPGLAWLLICQSLGEILARLKPIGLPGPVIGMVLMLGLLYAERVRRYVSAVASGLLSHLSLLFVPVGVGVMTHMALIAQYGWQLLTVLLLSTWAGLLVTALVLRSLTRHSAHSAQNSNHADPGHD